MDSDAWDEHKEKYKYIIHNDTVYKYISGNTFEVFLDDNTLDLFGDIWKYTELELKKSFFHTDYFQVILNPNEIEELETKINFNKGT